MISLLAAALASLTAVRDSYPVMSPDGSRLLFRSTRNGSGALWIANADGSSPRLLFDGGGLGSDPTTPDWSPDGRLILFAMRPAGATNEDESDIYVMDADGSRPRPLAPAPGDDSHPHWSADGKRIFFNSARATPDLSAPWGKQWIDIYSMAADGSDVRRITDCRAVCTYPSPSPDGRQIAYRRVLAEPGRDWSQREISSNSEVFVADVDGGSARNLSRHPAFDGWPTWSPDGQWILFASGRDGVPDQGQIYRIRPDGTRLTRLSGGRLSHTQPRFAGKDAILVYEHVEEGETEFGGIARLKAPLE